MKIKFLLISILLIISNGCGDKVEYTKIALGDVVKISSDYSSYDKADIVFAWSPPISNNGSIPKFEIDNNVLYFSPDTIGKYSIKLTIESMGGEPIIEEEFYYEGVSTLADSGKNYNNINFPSDLRKLSEYDLKKVSNEVRKEMISAVSETGGHLGAGLGVVELTVALHYVFDTPNDKLIWDVGHQTYPHKILTGRKNKIRT